VTTVDPHDALQRRLEALAALEESESAPHTPSVDLSGLRAEVAGVRADLGSMRAEMGAVRADLDALGGRLTGSVAASRSETSTLVRRLAEMATRLEAVGGRVDEVRTGMPALAREVREAIEQVPGQAGARLEELSGGIADQVGLRLDDVAADVRRALAAALEQESGAAVSAQVALVDARGAIESRLAVLEDALDGMIERIESLARDGASTTTAKVDGVAEGVVALGGKLDDHLERTVARLRDATEQRFDDLVRQLESRHEELRRDIAGALEQSVSKNEATHASLEALADNVRNVLESFSAAVASGLGMVGTAVTTSMDEGREELRKQVEDLAGKLLTSSTALQEQMGGRADAQAAQLSALQAGVEARVEAVRASVVTAMGDLRAEVVNEVGSVRPQVEELAAASGSAKESFGTLRVDLADAIEALRERLSASTSESAEAVRAALADTRTEVASLTRTSRTEVLDRLEERFSTLATRLTDVVGTVTGSATATRETQERVATLSAAYDEVRRALEALRLERAKPAEKAAKTAEAPAKPVEKAAEKTADKPAGKAADAASEKSAEKSADSALEEADHAPEKAPKAPGNESEQAPDGPGPAKTAPTERWRVSAEQAAGTAKAEPAKAPARPQPAKAKAPAAKKPQPAKAAAKKAPPAKKAPAPAAKAQPAPAQPAKAPAVRPGDRRGRLDAMPQVPSPKVALDAAVDDPRKAGTPSAPRAPGAGAAPAGRPTVAGRPTPAGRATAAVPPARSGAPAPPAKAATSWAARPEPSEDDADVQPRRFFRRRKP
jgi:hypothetical protein